MGQWCWVASMRVMVTTGLDCVTGADAGAARDVAEKATRVNAAMALVNIFGLVVNEICELWCCAVVIMTLC